MYCPKCGAKQPEGAKFCIECGTKLNNNDSQQVYYYEGKNSKFSKKRENVEGHQKTTGQQVYYFEDNDGKLSKKREKAKRKNNSCLQMLLTTIGFLIALIVLIMIFSENEDTNNQSSDSSITEKTIEKEADEQTDDSAYFAESDKKLKDLDEIDRGITDTLIEAGYSIEHATAIQEILNTIGVDSIEIENMTGEPESGLNAVVCYPNGFTDRDRRFYFTTEDGKMFYAGFLDEDLYDSDKGGYLKNYNDVHVPKKKVSVEVFAELQLLSEDIVKQYLNYPETADFDVLSYSVARSDNKYQITGSVNAKNGFGVEDKIPFSVWFTKKNGKFTVKGVSLNGIRVQ